MDRLKRIVGDAQTAFRERLRRLEGEGGLTSERYARYLSMQYHLTNGVQRHFLMAAAHPDLAHRRSLRKFLFDFANEEELHYQIAKSDLKAMGREPMERPLDVDLWWAFFDKNVAERPFVRLGATCVLENLSGGSGEEITRLFAKATFLTPKNTRFFVIHRHDETLPHGDQILAALAAAGLEERHMADLMDGARIARILYLRMVEWALDEQATLAVV